MEIALAIILIFAFLFAFVVFIKYKKGKQFSSNDNRFIKNHWEMVENEPNLKQAVIEADKLLDFALGKKGLQGNLGEKLKNAQGYFTDINSVWAAHKLRNRIAHEMNIKIYDNEAKRALKQFKQGLKDLGVKF